MMYDIVGARLSNLPEARHDSLYQFLWANAAEWSVEQRRAVLFYIMHYEAEFDQNHDEQGLPYVVWNMWCVNHFSGTSGLSKTMTELIPKHVCLQAAGILEEYYPDNNVLRLLGITAHDDALYKVETDRYVLNRSKCFSIVSFGRNSEGEDLLQSCEDVNPKFSRNTPLSYAVGKENVDLVLSLLERGADINHSRSDGRTALILAARSGQLDFVMILLEHGANPGISDGDGRTALQHALKYDRHEIVQLLRDRGSR